MSTANHGRIQKISEKLNGIDLKFSREKILKSEFIENKCRSLESKFISLKDTSASRRATLREQIQKLQKCAEEEASMRTGQLDIKIKEVMDIEHKYSYLIEQEVKERKESTERILRYLEERMAVLKSEIHRNSKISSESFEQLLDCVESDVPKIHDSLGTEMKEREDSDNRIIKRLNDDLGDIEAQIKAETRARDENEQAIFEMLREVTDKVRREIESEKQQREETEEKLLNLLEEACSKIEGLSI